MKFPQKSIEEKIKSKHKIIISIIKKVAKKNNIMKITRKRCRKCLKINKDKKIR